MSIERAFKLKVCSECCALKPLDDFHRHKHGADGRHPRCKLCVRLHSCGYNAARRAAKLQRTPAWADREKIQAVYEEARRLTDVFGVEYQVDHIEPLRGARVCGLHVAENLRVISAGENRRKSNLSFDDYQFRALIQ